MLFYALERQPYDYYTLLRWVTFGASSYSALIAYKAEKTEWAVILGITALLFNPLIPVNLRRETWVFIDLAAGILLLVSLLFVQRDLESSTTPAVTTNEPLILHQRCLFDKCSHKCSKCSMEFIHGCKICLPNNPNATECTYWIGPDKSFMCSDCLYEAPDENAPQFVKDAWERIKQRAEKI